MNKFAVILLSVISTVSFAGDLNLAPPSFTHRESKAVFVDFQTAHYAMKFDFGNKRVQVVSTIVFQNSEAGLPLFDLVPDVVDATLNGEKVNVVSVNAPNNVTTLKALERVTEPGIHTVVIRHTYVQNTVFELNNVHAALFTSDLTDRHYLEKFLPTNLEYDHFQPAISIDVTGTAKVHRIYTNGTVKRLTINKWEISYPAYYTCSSLYLHLLPENDVKEIRSNYVSQVTGRNIPITIYAKQAEILGYFKMKVDEALESLESDFGPWPHPEVLVYAIDGSGGMEYAGATITALSAVGHELAHSYFGRGIMAAGGNSGWIDEAIASWRDKGYQSLAIPDFDKSSIAGHSPYMRKTDTDAYSKGASFIAYLNSKMFARGGALEFLRGILRKYTYQSIDTPTFQAEAESFLGYEMTEDFNRYIYSPASDVPQIPLQWSRIHRFDSKQLGDLL